MKLRNSSTIIFHSLRKSTFAEDGLYTIFRPETDSAIRIDADVVAIISLLAHHNTIFQVAQRTHDRISEIKELITTLIDVGFVKQIDNKVLPDTTERISPLLESIPKGWFRWIIYKPLLLLGLLFITGGIMIALLSPSYIPTYKNFFWTQDLFVAYLSMYLINLFVLLLHELGHFCTTRAVGAKARILLDYRYIFLVAEVVSYQLAVVPKRFRYLVYISGIYIDFLIMAGVYWVFLLADVYHINLGIMHSLLSLILLNGILAVTWQFNIFIETDLYNFIADFFGHDNLRANAKKYLVLTVQKWQHPPLRFLQKLIVKLFDDEETRTHADDLRQISKAEKRQLVFYSSLFLIGLVIITLQFLIYTIPRDVIYLTLTIRSMLSAAQHTSIVVLIKSAVVFLVIIQNYFLVAFMYIRKRNKTKNALYLAYSV